MVEWFLHILRKYIYDLFNVFRRKWLNLLYTDFKCHVNALNVNVPCLNKHGWCLQSCSPPPPWTIWPPLTSHIHLDICTWGFCANSLTPPLCESFRCGELWNIQDVWLVKISITTHYNSIHMIISCPQVQIDRGYTGETPWKHNKVTCTVTPL